MKSTINILILFGLLLMIFSSSFALDSKQNNNFRYTMDIHYLHYHFKTPIKIVSRFGGWYRGMQSENQILTVVQDNVISVPLPLPKPIPCTVYNCIPKNDAKLIVVIP